MSDGRAPSAFEAYGSAWTELKRRFLELLLVGVVWLLVTMPSGWFRESAVGIVYQVLVLGPLGFGGMYAFLRAARGEIPEVSDLFLPFRRDYAQAVLASILMSALIGLGFVLLVVPGIVAAVRLAWVPYVVVDERTEAVAAIRVSWERTRPYAWTIFAMFLIAIPLALAGALLLGVGVIPAMMWIQLASALLYVTVAPHDRTVANVVGTGAPPA
jgi:uncharacterized membrane protein